MIWLYRILFIPTLLLLLPHYLRRMIKRGGYIKDFSHRFGFNSVKPKKSFRIWLQAVSVGEVNAIKPLITTLKQKAPHVEIILSTTTSTAYALAKNLYSDLTTAIFIFPIDFVLFSKLAWHKINPDLVLLMEQELWPEHLHQAKKRNIPAVLINARLSDKSFQRYKKFDALTKQLTGLLDKILVSNDQDFHRFTNLTLKKDSIVSTGNLKLDVSLPKKLSQEEKLSLKKSMGFAKNNEPQDLILLGSSTWAGEEVFLIETFIEALSEGIPCKLLIIPRHAERKTALETILKSYPDLSYHFRSNSKHTNNPVDIYIADTTGEMTVLSQVADVAFIGKSLPPNNGGQTPIEPATMGLPIIYGPNMSNFRRICESLEESKAALKGSTQTQVKQFIFEVLKNESLRNELSQNSQKWIDQHQGATQKVASHLLEYIK